MGWSASNRIFLLLAACLSLALLSGCINVSATHTQLANGSAVVTQALDMSSIISLASSYGGEGSSYGQTAVGLAMAEVCRNVTLASPDIRCSYASPGTITLEKAYGPSEAFYTFETRDDILVKRYRLTVDQLPDMSSSLSTGDDSSYSSYLGQYTGKQGTKLSDPASKVSAASFKALNMKYDYRISMPGRITKAQGAKSMNDSAAVFDVVDMMDKSTPMVVESEEMNWLVVGALALSGVVMLGILAVAIYLAVRK